MSSPQDQAFDLDHPPEPFDINMDHSSPSHDHMHLYSHSDDFTSIGSTARPKRRQVKNACVNCQKACKKCDDARPCLRCTKYGIGGECTNSVRKERKKGIKRGPYKKREVKGSNAAANRQSATSQNVGREPANLLPPLKVPGSPGLVDRPDNDYPLYRPSAPPPLAFTAGPAAGQATTGHQHGHPYYHKHSSQPPSPVSPEGSQYSPVTSPMSVSPVTPQDNYAFSSSSFSYYQAQSSAASYSASFPAYSAYAVNGQIPYASYSHHYTKSFHGPTVSLHGSS